MSAFAALLRRSLAEAGMSQMDLARAVGTSSSVVSQACTGQRPPPLERIDAWAQALRLAPAGRDALLAAAQLAHAPEPVRRRIDRLEQRLQEVDGSAWDERGAPSQKPREPATDVTQVLRGELDACRRRAEASVTESALADAAWEVHGLVAALLLRLGDGWLLDGLSARSVRGHLVRAADACRAARPTRPASLRAALRRVASELGKATRALDPAPASRPRKGSRKRG